MIHVGYSLNMAKYAGLRSLSGTANRACEVSFHSKIECRCRIEFWPHWILTRGVLIQRAVLRIQQIFHVELRPPRQGVIVLRPLRRIKFGPPVELWPRVLIPHWIMTPGLNSTLNFDPESWFNVKLRPGIGIKIQCEIQTQGHHSTWNFDPGHN